ncbi:MAG: hypothetical protein K0U47_11735 [Epsilonproteobacteria bacterium]|nr:hypothetical protein [Campylobacterota bacterium]
MKKLSLLLSSLLVASTVTAADTKDMGKIVGAATWMHIMDGKDNGFDPNTGSAYYLNLGYVSPVYNGLSFKISGYVVGDTGLTDEDDKIAGGIFMGDAPNDLTDTEVNFGEVYVKYASKELNVLAGHFKLDTPMTKNAYSTAPNLYEGLVLSSKAILPKTTLIGAHLSKMAYGARSLADFSLIGEGTTTAGASKFAKTTRGEFENFGTLAGLSDTTSGITTVGIVNKSLKNVTIQAWDYYAHDIANIFYADVNTKYKIMPGMGASFGAQVLYEDMKNSSASPTLFGVKAGVGYKGAKLILAYNKSGDDAFVNPWGGDPAYTSSIFSRNAYRADVSAYKVTFKYKVPQFYNGLPKNLTLVASHADYGQSSWANAQTDAKETDLAIVCKPKKNLILKLFNAQRTSERDGLVVGGNVKDFSQNHTRFIAKYKF